MCAGINDTVIHPSRDEVLVTLRQKWLFFFRAFFPTWVFFTEAVGDILLEVQTPSGWKRVIPPICRGPKNLFWNARNNMLHACNNSLHHLLTDVNELEQDTTEAIEALPSYKIVKNVVEYFIKESGIPLKQFQFRLIIHYPAFAKKADDVFLVSPNYEVVP